MKTYIVTKTKYYTQEVLAKDEEDAIKQALCDQLWSYEDETLSAEIDENS